jgi:predicted enzyme related to lactoylglutathione lyase
MQADPVWLALEVKYLDRACAFYEDVLGVEPSCREHEAAFDVGGCHIVLRAPAAGVPRGGVHTHYALAVPPRSYDDWLARLEDAAADAGRDAAVVEHSFGSSTSMYLDDPDDHCLELGEAGRDDDPRDLQGLFEVVLEAEDLEAASAFYEALGAERRYGDGEHDRRRLDWGGVDIELWEPRLGIADGRGGVHVDLGVAVDDPTVVADAVADAVTAREPLDTDDLPVSSDDGAGASVRVRDPDGHYLSFVPPSVST